jgi:hypothetical protein
MKINLISSCLPGPRLQWRDHETVMFFLSTMEPLTDAANLRYLPFWQNAFSAERASEMGRTNDVQ